MELIDIKGVGDKVAQKLNNLGITTVKELVEFLPSSYIDLGKSRQLSDIALGEYALVKVVVSEVLPYRKCKNGIGITQVVAYQEEIKLVVSWFNMPYVASKIELVEYFVYGKVMMFKNNYSMTNPIFKGSDALDEVKNIIPIYPLKETIPQATFRKIMSEAIDKVRFDDNIGNIDVKSNYAIAHTASSMKNIYRAQYELALHEMAMQFYEYRKYRDSLIFGAKVCRKVYIDEFVGSLPYALTATQEAAVNDILNDFACEKPMNRLLLGDVGSGKTVVAMCALYANFKSGGQGVLVAPTEVLAEQHYQVAQKFLSKFGISVVKMTANGGAVVNKEIKNKIKQGIAHVIVGTHSCFSKDVGYENLTLAIIDELHKFGVKQRAAIVDKGIATDCLVMSATPLPRTLAMVLYGDLKESKLELRSTQSTIKTYIMRADKLAGLYEYIRKHLKLGEQAYIVCPRIEDADGLELAGAKSMYDDLKKTEFKDYRIALIHGKMSGEEKTSVMTEFMQGSTELLVATGLIEVGIDAQNATIIAIMSADSFGLSALHQLRGRVGRGKNFGECFLQISAKVPPERILALKDCNDGIKLAELDARLRGMGDIIGVRQNGKRGFERYKIKISKSIVMQAKRIADSVILPLSVEKCKMDLGILLN